MILLAHAGHWLLNLLYVLPIVTVLGAAVRAMIRDRRDHERAADEQSENDEVAGS